MAYAFVQQVVGTKLQSGASATVGGTFTAGNLLVLVVPYSSQNREVTGVAGGGTWARGPAVVDSDSSSCEMWYCLNATGGATTVTVTMDSGTAANITPILLEYSGVKTSGAVQGTPQSLGWTTGASPRATGTLTTTANGCLLVGCAYIWTPSRPPDDQSGYTTRVNETGVNTALKVMDKRQSTAVGETFPASWTGGNATGVLTFMAFEEIPPAGPTITVQPTAQTARLNGDTTTTATFNCTSTGTGTVTHTAEIESSVGSGTYGTLANGSGATWTGLTASGSGSASTTLVGTFTAKTQSGKRVRIKSSDTNGDTYSDAVVLTVLDGPVLSAASATTNGSGVATVTMTSDDALSANGEILLVTATVRGQVVARTTVRPA